MKFSVVIPLYKGAPFIESTLDSVLAQTYNNYEIILVNDESPDNVGEIVKKYIADHPGVKFIYIEQKNKGLGGARNSALKQASGDIIAILDQDDIWYPEKLARVAKIYREHPEISITTHNLHDLRDGKIVGVLKNGPGAADMQRALLYSGNLLSTPAVTFKKSIIEDVGYFSEDKEQSFLCEDYDLWLRAAAAGHKFYFMPEILGGYTLHANNFTNSHRERMYQSVINIISSQYLKLNNKNIFDWFRFRRAKANMYYNWSYYLLASGRPLKHSLKYLWKSFKTDPLFFSLYVKVGKIIARKILPKRKIGGGNEKIKIKN
ncbi:MAG: glycosyltransferase [Candidatus Margulisbacteria bacterium]|nr:glycosyltransferase [Candidatus Margulisiibacteriota bacterium]MBU1022114.1 glycosyltransferase [Candidatus Margulisiibacteriota bacterium]MBU1728630.1 glycosyltransferase [Candidatus Margulisiibacteriota bacterium]MBU1955081.1 glycosyltransferase [Candidatus Margulisiibacteriota bacterium]